MKATKYLAASAVTALAAIVAVNPATAAPLPPKTTAAVPGAAQALLAPAPAVPTFVNGMSQAVFASGTANYVNEDLWVELDVDSDGDGKKDRVHTDVSRPTETNTDGLKVPVIFEDSPYYAGGPDQVNWAVDHELGVPPALRALPTNTDGRAHTSTISTVYESTWLPRGYAVVHAESPGSGSSTGCPDSGAPIETQGAVGVIEWLNGKRKAFTTRDGSVEAAPVTWHNGNTAMMGTSYNGTLPIAAASTGVEGLKAIVPISAISDWYDYYRANGAVKAPGGYQGEDLDVLTEYVYTRNDENGRARAICRPIIENLKTTQDRVTGNRSALWDARNYMTDVKAGKLKAATLIAHGGNDFNVMTKHATQLYDELKKQNIPHQFYFHQGGHGGSPPDYMLNLWFTKYLWNQDNGVQNLPKSYVVRETTACPPRQSTLTAEAPAGATTLTVASAAAFRVGHTLTIPQTSATGTVANTTRVITNIAGNTLTLATAVSTGQRVVEWCDGQPRLRHGEPVRVPRVAGRGRGQRGAQAQPGRQRPRRAHPGRRDRHGEAGRRRQDHGGDADERGDQQRPPGVRDEPAHAGRPHLRHADGQDQGRLQQAEGEPDRDPRLAAGDRHRHDPHAWLDRPGEPQLGLRDRRDHARHVLRLQLPADGQGRGRGCGPPASA